MKNISFEKFDDDLKAKASLSLTFRHQLQNLELGKQATPRSWFYERREPKEILEYLENLIWSSEDLATNLQLWEIDQASKFKPQGEVAPLKDRMDTLQEYFYNAEEQPRIIKDPLFKRAQTIAIKELGFNQTGKPISAESVISRGLREMKYDTSSGYPLWLKRKNRIAIKNALKTQSSAIEQEYPCVLGSRGSMGKTGRDARHIFMASMPVNVRGQRYQQPLQDFIRSKKIEFFAPWEGWTHTLSGIKDKWEYDYLKVGADYSKMDQHFNLFHGLAVYDVIKHYFRREYWSELYQIIEYVFVMPIVTNFGVIKQIHCMPSGSEWTNFLETVWNYIFMIYFKLKYNHRFVYASGIGDDQLWILDMGMLPSQRFDIMDRKADMHWMSDQMKWMKETILKEFNYAGLPGNEDKQEISFNQVSYLRRFFTNEHTDIHGKVLGVYSLIRSTTSQVYPEFFYDNRKWDSDLFALRTLMIANNTEEHPLFLEYMKYVSKSNHNLRQFMIKKAIDKEKAIQSAREINNFIPNYVGKDQVLSNLGGLESMNSYRTLEFIYSFNK